MGSPIQTGKKAVDLAAGGVRVSKIRRDPPLKVKEIAVRDRDEVDRRTAAIGVVAFTLAILVIIIGFASYNGWSPSNYTVRIRMQ
jgi:hypothetical protein